MSRLRLPVQALAVLAGFLIPWLPFAVAAPSDYVFVPYAEAGVWRLAYDTGAERGRDGGLEKAQALSLGWTPLPYWFTAIYAGWYAEPGEPLRFYAASWRNHLQLTDPGGGPLQAGLLCDLERPREHDEGTGITCGATLQFDAGRWQVNVNPLIEKYVGAQAPAAATFKYQWQLQRLWQPGLELGLQGFGATGPLRHWLPAAQQEHSLGPSLFAKWPTADGRAWKLDTAWLFGMGAGSPRSTARLRLQREF
jgi:hypothetical protein